MIEFERARKSDEEISQKQVEEKRLREEEKEKVRISEWERAEQVRQEELKLQKESMERAEAERQERLKLEQQKIALKEAQLKEEKQNREAQEQRRKEEREEQKRKQEESETMVSKIKKIGDAMKHVLPKMPNDMMEVPLYFETVENAFRSFNVQEQFWVKLLLPLMTPKARTVLNRLSFADLDDYEIVKQHLLKEFKLTPREYRSKFIDAKKTAEETYTMFTARLKNLLNYYVKSRKVDKNFEKLFDLLVADKLKESLPPGPLQFVLSKEGTDCYEASVVADLADIHVNNRIGLAIPNKTSFGFVPNGKRNQQSTPNFGFDWKSNQEKGNQFRGAEVKSNFPAVHENRESMMARQRQVYNKSPPRFVAREGNASFTPYKRKESIEQRGAVVKRCHNCGSDRHLMKFCPVPVTTSNYGGKQENSRVNRIQVVDNSESQVTEHQNNETEIKSVMKCHLSPDIQKEILLDNGMQKEMVERDESTTLKKVLLQYVEVEIRGTAGKEPIKVKALIDSGAEVPVISEELLEGMQVEQIGKVNLQCVAGDAIPAKLVKVDVRLCGNDVEEEIIPHKVKCSLTPYVTLMCASIPKMGSTERFLLHPEIIAELKAVPQVKMIQGDVQANVTTRLQSQRKKVVEVVEESETESSSEEENESDGQQDGITAEMSEQEMAACKNGNLNETKEDNECDVAIGDLFEEDEKDEEQQMQIADAKKFEEQQRQDESLKAWWNLAPDKESEFCVVNGLLYKRYRILEQTIYQLVLPKERRIKVMELAHESVFGGHLGEEKTRERIKLSFTWPKMRRDIVKFCKSYEKCQLKARSLVMDRQS